MHSSFNCIIKMQFQKKNNNNNNKVFFVIKSNHIIQTQEQKIIWRLSWLFLARDEQIFQVNGL